MTAEGKVTAENKCRTSRPIATEICDMGSCVKTWFFTEWAEEVGFIHILYLLVEDFARPILIHPFQK
jgi:hypothetical protein